MANQYNDLFVREGFLDNLGDNGAVKLMKWFMGDIWDVHLFRLVEGVIEETHRGTELLAPWYKSPLGFKNQTVASPAPRGASQT